MTISKSKIGFLGLVIVLAACNGRGRKPAELQEEDRVAKQLLQGIWINADDESVAFKVSGDTIFYPDTTSRAVYFQIVKDTLTMHGVGIVKYPIVKQAPHLFVFKNQNGETVTLTLSEDPNDRFQFENSPARALNQNRLLRRDTVVTWAENRYHCYVQVNPTTYKVVKSTFNDEGVEVENIYYDNIIHLAVFNGSRRLFSRDFRKADFRTILPAAFLSQAILSDMLFRHIDRDGVHYQVFIGIPDSPSYYIVSITISTAGRMTMQLGN